MKKIVAIVPMKHHSERVPNKNFRNFAGKPLYHHIINTLLKTKNISQIVIDTDSPLILEDAAKNFPQVTLLERPEHLRGDYVPMNDVLLNTIDQTNGDFYLQTHSTNPLLKSETIDKAIELFISIYPRFDSLFSVTKIQTRLYDSLVRPINHNPAILLRTQDLPPVFEENSCIYLFTKETLDENHNRIGRRPYMFEISKYEAIDIDEEIDFQIAECLFNLQNKKQND